MSNKKNRNRKQDADAKPPASQAAAPAAAPPPTEPPKPAAPASVAPAAPAPLPSPVKPPEPEPAQAAASAGREPAQAEARDEDTAQRRRGEDRSTERVPAKSGSGRNLPAPLAVLDADYSQVLRMRNVRYMIVIGAVVGALWFGWYLSAIFVPLLIALGIAYVLNPLVELLERRGVSRLRAVVLIFTAFIALSVAAGTWFVVSLAKDVRNISHEIGGVLSDIETKQDQWVDSWNELAPEQVHLKKGELTIAQITEYIKEKVAPKRQAISPEERQAAAETINARAQLLAGFQRMDRDNSMYLEATEIRPDTLRGYDTNGDGRVSPEEWFAHFGAGTASQEGDRVLAPEAQRAAEGLLGAVGSGLMSVLYIGLCLVLIPIYTWFFLLGLPGIMKSLDRYLPGAQKPRIRRIIGEIDGMAKSFFRGRLIVVLIIAVMTTILFVALDVRYSFLLGLLAGVGILVPFASFILSMAPAALLMATTPEPSWAAIAVMIAIFCAIQAFEQYVLTPKLLGDAVELHPITLLVGVFVMTYLFGVFGALLAVPLTAIAKTMGREFLLPYFKSLADEPQAPSGMTRVIKKS